MTNKQLIITSLILLIYCVCVQVGYMYYNGELGERFEIEQFVTTSDCYNPKTLTVEFDVKVLVTYIRDKQEIFSNHYYSEIPFISGIECAEFDLAETKLDSISQSILELETINENLNSCDN